MSALVSLALGALFGYLLSMAGATEYDFYAQLFLFQDLQLMWVIGAAVVVSLPGMYWLKRRRPRAWMGGGALELTPKPMRRGLVVGALLFGAGWGLAGACPGTALAMLGQGKLTAGITVLVALFLAPLFRTLPEATLAAIVIVAVSGMMEVRKLARLWRVSRPDLVLADGVRPVAFEASVETASAARLL